MSGKKRKKYSGNLELVETRDIQGKREKAFWKCRAGRGNRGCLGKQEKTFWECEASGGETGDVWEEKYIFWECGTGGNWGYPE